MEILVFSSVVPSIFGIFGVFFKNALWDPLAHHLATKPLPLASGTLRGQEGQVWGTRQLYVGPESIPISNGCWPRANGDWPENGENGWKRYVGPLMANTAPFLTL